MPSQSICIHVSQVMLDGVLYPQPKEEKEEEDEILTELMRKQAELKAVVSDLSNELDILVMYWTSVVGKGLV